jgi:hypothetical protein
MRIHHVVAQDNGDGAGMIRDPRRARHCVVVAGRIADLSGEVDPATHLNRDFLAHQLGQCIVAERLQRGAAVLYHDAGFLIAAPSAEDIVSLGSVDLDRRRIDWLAAHRARSFRPR